MERTTIALIVLCLVLLFAQFFMREGFFDAVTDVITYCVDASGAPLPCGKSGKCVSRFGNFVTCSTSAVISACYDASGNKNTCGSSGQCVNSRDQVVYCSNNPGNSDWGYDSWGGGWGNGWGSGAADVSQSQGNGWGGWSGWGGGWGGDDSDSDGRQGPQDPQGGQGGQGPQGSQGGSYSAQFASLRADIRDDLRKTIKKEVAKSCSSSDGGDADDSCSSEDFSPAAEQGAQFLKEVYGQDAGAYIRKDSIPCYNCAVP